MANMKALRILEQYQGKPSKFEIAQVDIPEYGDNEVLIKVMGAAICGTDKHFYEGLIKVPKIPIIMGHEFSGEIVAVGKNVKNTKPGDRIVCELQVDYCGVCKVCHSGATHLCRHKKCPGLDMEGSYAQYIAMPANMVHKLPDAVSYRAAAVTEPAAIVATGLLERCRVFPEEIVVIFGAGPLGLCALQMCKAVGANTVIMVEGYNKKRSDKAKELGADYVIDDPETDVVKFVMELTNGLGADLCVDCAGAEQSLNDSIHCLHKNGRICYIGVPFKPLTADFFTLVCNAVNIISTYASTSSAWDTVISMVARGALDLESLVTHTYDLEDYMDAFRVLVNNEAIKVVFTPNGAL
jgi:L-iditol 2-dehydrogenase